MVESIHWSAADALISHGRVQSDGFLSFTATHLVQGGDEQISMHYVGKLRGKQLALEGYSAASGGVAAGRHTITLERMPD